MKLITWNIQWGRGIDGRVDLKRIVDTARALADFDVLCLQEVADNVPGLPGNDDINQFAAIGALLPGFQCVEGISIDVASDQGRRRRFGNAIYSRYSVLAARRHALPWPADPESESTPRVAVEAVLRAPIGPLRVTTTHLEYYSAVLRAAQARRVRELHEEACAREARPSPVDPERPFGTMPQTASAVLTGDFNLRPDDALYEEIQAPVADGPRYRDAWASLRGREPHRPTFCLYTQKWSKSPYCCDFVFVSDNLASRLRRIEVDAGTQASDHQPVLVEIDDR